MKTEGEKNIQLGKKFFYIPIIVFSSLCVILLLFNFIDGWAPWLLFNNIQSKSDLEGISSLSKLNGYHFNSSVAFCLMIKDDDDSLEWINYHQQLGVSKFYVFDNGSDPPLESALQFFIQSGLVEYEFTYGDDDWLHIFVNKYIVKWRDSGKNKQNFIYDKCLTKYGHLHKWMGFFDVDEFVVLVKDRLLQDVLKNFDHFGGLNINWMMFGSSGHINRPKSGVLGYSGNFTKCSNSTGYKSIVQPSRVVRSQIHDAKYKEPWFPVTSDKVPISDHSAYDLIYLNHYSIKSLEDYKLKMKRGAGNDVKRRMDYWYSVNNDTIYDCPILFLPPKYNTTTTKSATAETSTWYKTKTASYYTIYHKKNKKLKKKLPTPIPISLN